MRERLKAAPNAKLVQYILEPALQSDAKRTFQNMMRCNLAHTVMLCRQGIISKDAAQKLLRGLKALIEKGPSVLPMKTEFEDLFYNIEQYLIQDLTMEVAGQLHTARSRNDLGVACIRMNVRDSFLRVFPLLLSVRATLLKLAEEHADTVITGYTHMQPAQPVTLGFYLAGIAEALERDFDRFMGAYARLNLGSMGAGAFAGTGFPIDRQITAELLGFSEAMENTLDCVAGRDGLLEIGADLSIMGSTVNRFTHDLYYWATNEFMYIEMDNSMSGSSSIMPQKKNPFSLEHIKSKSAHLIGDYVSMITVLKGIPFGHCRDLSEMLAPLFSAIDDSVIILDLLDETLKTMKVHSEGMKDRADRNYSTVTELSDELVRSEGIPFRVAYQIVGSIVGDLVDKGLSAKDITTELLDAAGMEYAGRAFHWPQEKVAKALDSMTSVVGKECYGAPGPKATRATIAHLRGRLAGSEKEFAALTEALAASEKSLDTMVNEILA